MFNQKFFHYVEGGPPKEFIERMNKKMNELDKFVWIQAGVVRAGDAVDLVDMKEWALICAHYSEILHNYLDNDVQTFRKH